MKRIFAVILLFITSQYTIAQDIHRLSPTPPMGWNSWNWYAKRNINEKVVREVIDILSGKEFRGTGYNYVVVDGGWRDTKLGPNGELLIHAERFPNGIKALADYAHSKGLKFGLHTVPGTHDCGGDAVGGFGNEEVQIKQFIAWGVDFIKLDKCRFTPGWDEDVLKDTYVKWSKILKESKSDIVLSISAYKFRDWSKDISNMVRTTSDISPKVGHGAFFDEIPKEFHPYKSVMGIADENNKLAKFAGNGYWNDPDMLVTGAQGLSHEEQKVHFALWCIMTSPLMIGSDLINMTKEEKSILLNRDAIMIDQDPTEQGTRIKVDGDTEIWAKKLKDGRVAALLINRNKSANKNIQLNFSDLGISGKVKVKDVYEKKKLGTHTTSITKSVKPRSGLFILID
ncbi:glycoside hydrolase family 27 protein [Chitinophaga sp. MM2321]|uniref:glycoside hydrolase family 27 protein n=1 Tax=Chitinophaga sp. MM2321 TaxID=3137178 RepID=UPI0032D58CEC